MKAITWNTKDGKAVTVTVDLKTSRTINADGDKVEVKCCEIEIFATAEGLGVVGSGRPEEIKHPELAAKIGKLGITAARLAEINEAIAEVEATPEWQAKMVAKAQAEKAEREYDAHRAKMAKVMGS